ncbi:MAG: hypothetical protein VW937_03410 [Actinomycetota bacterium]
MSTLVMSLGMIAFFAVVMAIAWRRYQRHATKAAERSRAAMVQLLTDSEGVAAQSQAENSGENQGEGAHNATASTDHASGADGLAARDAEAFDALVENFHSESSDER